GLLSLFTTTSGLNDGKYSSTAFDTYIADANSATDLADRFQNLYDAQAQLMEDLPIIPVYYYADTWLIQEYVVDWGRSSLGSIDFTHAKIQYEE
nr:peptide ABC transporter substrate-binding protein [Bacillota bacterium]